MKLASIAIVLLLTGCSGTQTAVLKKDPSNAEPVKIVNQETVKPTPLSVDSLITQKALSSYNEKYLEASSHKAFAQSDSGAWNWKSNRTSKQHAIDSALIACQAFNQKYEALAPCKIINVNGEWTEQ